MPLIFAGRADLVLILVFQFREWHQSF